MKSSSFALFQPQPDSFADKVGKTIQHYQQLGLIRWRQWQFDTGSRPLPAPIFVIGCSRAGTTLVYKTLSQSEALGSIDKETHDLWAELHPPSERDWDSHRIPPSVACTQDSQYIARWFYSQTGQARFVDKNNQNGLSVAYLAKLFPAAHFVYVKRHPGDNLLSLIRGWQKPSEFATWSDKLPAKLNLTEADIKQWCFFIAHGWREYINQSIADVCRFQYQSINQAILTDKPLVPPEQWHEVFYEDLVDDPKQSFAQLFATLQLPFESKLQQHCQDVHDKPYNTFSAIALNKWQQSEWQAAISEQLPQLAPLCHQMGYATESHDA
ncbi:sulfotransferase family protein [Motilimonas pumila]|uniref:Sulfotransferase n=1 Tax=Motilimonas pumila TaxID=2303987 RepID=A0A418YJ20_9GAMM|nr:sulfotransferase [Motilimonas pumila]RJG50646.1 sulfotransferase [Motilimonas pumila]